MVLTYTRVQLEAQALQSACQKMVNLLAEVNQLLEHNSDQAIDWGAVSKPAYIDEDIAGGNLSGYQYTRQQVSNAIGSLDWVRKLLTNQPMTGSQGDHLGNLNLLANP